MKKNKNKINYIKKPTSYDTIFVYAVILIIIRVLKSGR